MRKKPKRLCTPTPSELLKCEYESILDLYEQTIHHLSDNQENDQAKAETLKLDTTEVAQHTGDMPEKQDAVDND